ncbi:hypothetical protein CSOJ01_05680 [Colletotrichum sojae]|uniref:Uncharacterized protein n=1 Tax=Colletotrichum sojae TaxID=2175907 RepID=A0A8H6MWG7_9PEZI|nr:hypothetical protein CSOJ01_05680 [Colletotrichum sojae]
MLSLASTRLLPRHRQYLPYLYFALAVSLLLVFFRTEFGTTVITSVADKTSIHKDPAHENNPTPSQPPPPPKPKYKPQPTWTPPPVKDPFPLLMTSDPPPIPSWNKPKEPNVYHQYNLPVAPPLLIAFTRSWPMLLQTVVGYVTAGWPADQIFVVENTGVQDANAIGRLTLQHPLYLNHTQLYMLGVNIIRTPVLLNFAQLQNFFLSTSKDREWPYFFWTHMDSFVMSFEDGKEGFTTPVGTPGYQTIYELAVKELNNTLETDNKWAARFFAYDHLALVNPKAYDAIGGWDTFIGYYMTDCDMHWRLEDAGWTIKDSKAGIVEDVASVLDDLRMLYRERDVPDGFGFTDPNPPPPEAPKKPTKKSNKRQADIDESVAHAAPSSAANGTPPPVDPLVSFQKLLRISKDMYQHKHGARERNTWQLGQRGGDPSEPYHYDALGFQTGIDVITEAGREVFRRKWGHRNCDFGAAGLKPSDAWKVERDWE